MPLGSSALITPKKSWPVVEFDRVGLFRARGDRQLVVFEQPAQVVLKHVTLDGNLHLKEEGTVAIFLVDGDDADLALAKLHVGALLVVRTGHDVQARRPERAAQMRAQLGDFFLIHAQSLCGFRTI